MSPVIPVKEVLMMELKRLVPLIVWLFMTRVWSALAKTYMRS